MKYILTTILIVCIGLQSCKTNEASLEGTNASSDMTLNNSTDSMSYAIGISIAENLKSQGVEEFNTDILAGALKQQLAGEATMELAAADQYVRGQFQKIQDAKSAAAKQEGIDFLEANKSKDGVMTTASGLQYKVIKEGTGAQPVASDKVTVHYRGTLIDGTQFDSSYDRGQPASFGLNQVIKGWTEGLQLMKEGATYQFYIPQELGYGGQAAPGGAIPAFSTLIFDVELISIGG